MRSFEHGDHLASIQTMSAEAAEEAGLIPPGLHLMVPAESRFTYGFCPVCQSDFGRMITAVDFSSGFPIIPDPVLESGVIEAFREKVGPSCQSARHALLIESVMNA